MQDLRPNAVFLSSAFLPSREEVRAAVRRPPPKRRAESSPTAKRRKVEEMVIDLSSSDSDSEDDLPDLAEMFRSSPSANGKTPPKGKGRTTPAKKAPRKGKKAPANGIKGRRAAARDSDDEDLDGSESDCDSDSDVVPGKKGGLVKRGKRNEPDMDGFAMWKEGGSNVEASAKMLKMIEYLKAWESCGDKTIVFSQCKRFLREPCEQSLMRTR